jgi:hypothetical protein
MLFVSYLSRFNASPLDFQSLRAFLWVRGKYCYSDSFMSIEMDKKYRKKDKCVLIDKIKPITGMG